METVTINTPRLRELVSDMKLALSDELVTKSKGLSESLKRISDFFTAVPPQQPGSWVDKAKMRLPDLDSVHGRRIMGGVGAAISAAGLLAIMRELRREKKLDYVYGGHGKPGKGDIVVRVPRKRTTEDQKRASLENALGIIAAALATGGTYYGLTKLDDMRADRQLAGHEAKAKQKFREALEAKAASADIAAIVAEILSPEETGTKEAGLMDNVTTALWLLVGGLGLSSAYVTKQLADKHYGDAKKRDLTIPPERRVVFQSYDPETKQASSQEAEDVFKLALEVQKDLLRGTPRFINKPEFAELRMKIAQVAGDVPAAVAGLDTGALLDALQGIRKTDPNTYGTLLKDPGVLKALSPIVQKRLHPVAQRLTSAGEGGALPWLMGTRLGQAQLHKHVGGYLDSRDSGTPYQAPTGMGVAKDVLSHIMGGIRNKFSGLYKWFVGNKPAVTPPPQAQAKPKEVPAAPAAEPVVPAAESAKDYKDTTGVMKPSPFIVDPARHALSQQRIAIDREAEANKPPPLKPVEYNDGPRVAK